jgi:tripartite-type tricarboxylate transporter receptor subunit TctC
MRFCFVLRCFAAAAITAQSVSAALAAESAPPFYAGKQITISVGLPPGGGADAYARMVQRHLAQHIPGRPNIIVQNMPGAGSLKSITYLNTTAPADGTAVGTFSSELLDEALTARDRVNVDFRQFNWIGNVSEDLRVCYVWAATGITNWQGLRARSRPLFWGATAPGTAGNADSAMLQQLFGIRIMPVQGYAGSADKRLAVERREIDGDCGGWTAVPADWLRDRKINLLLRLSPTLVAGIDGRIPFAGDLVKDARERKLYDFLVAPERLGRLFVMSGKVPPARVAILRTAFDAMTADPAFRAEAGRLNLLIAPMTGQEVARRITELYATPPDIIAQAKKIFGE